MTTPDIAGLCERLRARIKRSLPTDWQKGRDCPECGVGADRPKCMWEMGGRCPRHDPDNYEPSPYIIVPDKDAHEAADTLERQAAEIKRLRSPLPDLLQEHVFSLRVDAMAMGEAGAHYALIADLIEDRAALTGEDAGGTG